MNEKLSITLQYFAVVLILGVVAFVGSVSPQAKEAREYRAWRQEVAEYRSRPADASSTAGDIEEVKERVVNEGEDEIEEKKVESLAYDQLWIQMPARPEIAQRQYDEDLSVDDALGSIFEEIKDYDPGAANGSYNISVVGGDGKGSFIINESNCAGDACGYNYAAYRNGVKQLEMHHASFYEEATFTVDGEEYTVRPKYGEFKCEHGYNDPPAQGMELLGVDVVRGENVAVSYDLSEKIEIPCIFYPPGAYYGPPRMSVEYVSSTWGTFGLGLKLGGIRIDIQFSDYIEEEVGVWR